MTEDEMRSLIFKLLKKLAPEKEPDKIDPESDIRKSLEIDSFDFLRFIVAIKENTSIDIPEKDYGKITTIKTLIEYLRKAA